jgi:cold shock protein
MVGVNGPQKFCVRGLHLTLADSCRRTAFVGDGRRHRSKTRPRSTTVDRHNRRGEEESMTQGTVRWFNRIKGIGFLNVDGGEPDVFVHFSAIETGNARSLDENRRVEFDIIQSKRTRQAARVRYI